MQTLEVFQSLWAMSEPSRLSDRGVADLDLSEQLDKIKAAGFAGVDIVYGDFPDREMVTTMSNSGLASTMTAFPDSVDALRPALELAKQLQVRHINIIGKVYPLQVTQGARFVEGWMTLCDEFEIPMTLETHRDCLTTDLHYVLQLMDAVPGMRLCADLSHFVVAREFGWPVTDEVQMQICKVLDRCDALQGRIASREQIQLQVEFPQHQKWVDVFNDWWLYGITSWCRRSAPDATLNFLCELGPPEYAMTDARGYELSDRWNDALLIKKMIEQLWNQTTD